MLLQQTSQVGFTLKHVRLSGFTLATRLACILPVLEPWFLSHIRSVILMHLFLENALL